MSGLLVAGLALVALAVVDLVWTVVAAGSGSGPLTGRLAAALWRPALPLSRGRLGHRVLVVAGVVIVLAMLLAWVAMILCGWWLVFSASDGAVRGSMTGDPADALERLYFAGYTAFTLGLGDYTPGKGWWQVATVACNGSGLVLLTLAVTYLVPVASAVAEKRQLAGSVAVLGDSGADILVRAWDGKGFGALGQHLVSLTPTLMQAAQHHLAYPVLHYFHNPQVGAAAGPNLRALADALLLLQHGVAPAVRPPAAATGPLDRALDTYLETLDGAFIQPVDDALAPPDRALLCAVGMPLTDEATWREAVERDRGRRRLVGGLLHEDGWTPDAGASRAS